MIKKLLLFLTFFTITFCKAQTKTDNDLYVAGYLEEDFNTAYLGFAKKSIDSISFFAIDENNSNVIPNQDFERDTLGLKTKLNVTDDKLVLSYITDKTKLDYHYFKVEDAEFTFDQVKEIKGKRYTTELGKVAMIPNRDLKIQREIHFIDSSNVEIVYIYSLNNQIIYTEKETKKSIIQPVDNKVFFSFYDEELNSYNRWYQLQTLTKDSLSLIHYAETKKIVDIYTLNTHKNLNINSSNFKMCWDRRPYEYYDSHPDISYKKGNVALLKRLIVDAPLAEGDGFITIHFAINCKGKVGRFGLEQMNNEYKSASFNPKLIEHLIHGISKITEWNLHEETSTDTHRFFMFKVRNGKITEVWP